MEECDCERNSLPKLEVNVLRCIAKKFLSQQMNALNQPESPTMITLTLSKDAIPKSRDTKTSELIKNK